MTVVLIKTSSVFSLIGRPQPDNVAAGLTFEFSQRRRRGQREHQNSNSKTTSLFVHHAFLYISLPLLHDYNVKLPNFAFYGGPKQATIKFSFSF